MKYLSYIAALIAGGLAVLSFAPFGYWWMSVFCLALLFILWSGRTSRQCFQLGWLFGLAYFGVGVSWVFNSLYDYGNAPIIVAALLTIAMVLYLSLFPALAGWTFARLCGEHCSEIQKALVFASSWTLFEWVRGWLISGFPWLSMGHALPDSFLSGWIPVSGSLGAGFVFVLFAALTVVIIRWQRKTSLIAALLLIGLTGISLGLYQRDWVKPVGGDALRVTLVQGNVGHELKWDNTRRAEVYARYIDLSLRYSDSDIVIWPETAIPTYYRSVKDSLLPEIKTIMDSIGAQLVTGIFTYDDVSGEIHNSLLAVGDEDQFYHKLHLVPFGEFLPFRWLFDFMQQFIQIPMSDLSPGEAPNLLRVKNIPVGASICYEAIFAEEIAAVLPAAQLLVNVTNDAWFGDSLAPHQHLQIAQTRSLETGRWMLRATNNGISAFIDPKGRITARTDQFVATAIQSEAVPMQGNTPFVIWKNYLVVILVCLILFIMPFLKTARSR